MKQIIKKLPLILVIAGVMSFGAYRLFSTESAPTRAGWGARDQALTVIVSDVAFEPIQTTLEAIGTSRAVRSIIVTPRVGGEVTEVAFQPGSLVDKGSVLLELDAREERLAVELAKVRLEQAERALKRANDLARKGTTTVAATDELRAARDEAQIALKQARIALADRTIRAPFKGYVGATDIDVGDRVTPTTQITTLDDRSELLVAFEAAERFIEFLKVGQAVDVKPLTGNLVDSPDAEISDIGSRVDATSRTFLVRAKVNNADDRYRPGQGFRIELSVDGERYASLPEVALLWGSDGAYVWKVEDGKAVRVPAVVVARRTGRVLIEAPLEPGDTIVSEGVQRVREGFAVKGISEDEQPTKTLRASRPEPAQADAAGKPTSGAPAPAGDD